MMNSLHHVHIFAANLEESIRFYQECFGGVVVIDEVFAGARNVFMKIGKGRLHLYDQAPRDQGRGGIHHFGIQTDDLDALVERMKTRGVKFKKGITDFGIWRYVMAPAPDGVLIELFEINKEQIPPQLGDYFEN